MIFLACVLLCCTQVLSPKPPWTNQDQKALDRARITCSNRDDRQTCLVKFRKVEESIYDAICGEDNR